MKMSGLSVVLEMMICVFSSALRGAVSHQSTQEWDKEHQASSKIITSLSLSLSLMGGLRQMCLWKRSYGERFAEAPCSQLTSHPPCCCWGAWLNTHTLGHALSEENAGPGPKGNHGDLFTFGARRKSLRWEQSYIKPLLFEGNRLCHSSLFAEQERTPFKQSSGYL